jgi:uncharacterized protein
MIRGFFLIIALLFAGPALAVDFPPLSGRVVDQANLLDPGQEAELTAKLEALQRATSRQLVVATVSSLQDLPIEDYGNQLGRAWRIGQAGANNGIILLVAPNERRVRIEVGYGLEGIMTDALSSRIIRDQITPRFRAQDYPGGINAGTDAIIAQLQAPPEAQEQAALAAQQAENASKARGQRRDRGGAPIGLIVVGLIFFFIVLPVFSAGLAGRRYRGRGRRGVSIWGPTSRRRGGAGSDVAWMLAGMFLSNIGRGGGGGGGSSWGGGGGSWGGGGGGGFSGGGGSFGGGGASGGW